MDLQKVCSELNLNPSNVLNVYQFGSRVYGTATSTSDWDFVIVCKDYYGEVFVENKENTINANVFNPETFQIGINEHYIYLLLCLFLPKQNVWKEEYKPNFTLCLPKLRSTVSYESARTWVKAKKKFTIENKKPLGRKNIVNSIREIRFAIQIATLGMISDYTICNELKKEVCESDSSDWDYYQKIYRPLFKKYLKEFRQVAPKDKAFEIIYKDLSNIAEVMKAQENQISSNDTED